MCSHAFIPQPTCSLISLLNLWLSVEIVVEGSPPLGRRDATCRAPSVHAGSTPALAIAPALVFGPRGAT